ncbi:MAG: 23S rRNA (guanosine(2251)-2'-O)-methyltransferase RlmB [Clostridiales bacterium]|nr:23S rRNA (guanosine(2251)-2'-O)-methyltransferase RlmB [Clostridiales bacterium]
MNKKPLSRQDHLKKDAKAWDKEERRAQKKNGAGEHNRFGKDDRFAKDERKFSAPRPQRTEKRFDDVKKPASRKEAPAFTQPQSFSAEPENLISGRNPIREAIKAGRDIEKILVAKGDLSATAREIVQMAREAHIPVQTVERTRLDEITRNHQGMLAFASAYRYYDVEDMLEEAREKGEKPFLIVLDSVTDPQNLGAIIRTAACVGAHGVIVPQRRAVGLTPSAVKASAGAIERIKVARVGNLSRTLEMLKEEGIWLYAADMSGEDYRKTDFDGAVALVIGSEGDGVSRLTMEKCDFRVKLPMTGAVDSLNASVAAGVLMYAVYATRN